jgi:hypothetical protein
LNQIKKNFCFTHRYSLTAIRSLDFSEKIGFQIIFSLDLDL